ncbi:MAG: hypothetical protein ABR910_04215 [Acidobacteriaceae bacterium]|jgi:outer membrane murein-binding lipoprotein Lpp
MAVNRRGGRVAVLLLFAAGLAPGRPGGAQQVDDTQTQIQQLRSEVKQIEARIDALERAQAQAQAGAQTAATQAGAAVPMATASAPAEAPAPAPPAPNGAEAVSQAEDKGMDTMDAGMGGQQIEIPHMPEMKIRGFGDVRGFIANQNLAVINSFDPGISTPSTQGGNSTFALGLMDLFITSQISEHFSYLSEVGFEADPSINGIGVDLERAQISYTPNEKFSISAGRTHAMLGYYNTAFHHGTWFQTTIDRPHIFEFEDSGGPLPIHNVGVSAMGKIPSGKLGLHWLAEVGNGKQTYSLEATVTPANVLADHTGKSTNIGLYARPEKLDGLQAGFDWYQASLVPVVALLPGFGTPAFAFPNAVDYYRQNIYVGHVVYIQPKLELMLEDAEMRDVPRGSTRPLYTSGGYAQVSRVLGVFRPYARFQWLNPNFRDPNNAWVGHWVGPNAGIRWDINAFIALKLEYSHYDWRSFSLDQNNNQVLPILHKTINEIGSQITYTF